MEVTIGVSNRHVHLKQEHLDELFGKGYELEIKNMLVQPGQFASNSTLTIKTEKSEIQNVRVLGPVRNYTQVEISKTDAFKLGLNPPIRDSGDLKGSAPIELIGPNGSIKLEEGCIIANRHIHITPQQVEELGLTGVEKVSVELKGEKGGIINNVYLKIDENFALEMHIDTDDANAHLIKTGDIGRVIEWKEKI